MARALKGAMLVAAVLLGAALVLVPGASRASAAVAFSQCSSVFNTPGLLIKCDVDITNTLDVATAVGSAVVVATVCTGPANIVNPTCVTPTTYQDVVGSVDQCNSSVNGGGANVDCSVSVHNIITGAATATGATVDQCIGSAGGGGTEPTLVCAPKGSTTNATVTQCNGSANGGGGTKRVLCTVGASTASAELPVTINQCNDSANQGGSTVICDAAVTNRINGTTVAPPAGSATGGGSNGPNAGGGSTPGGGTGNGSGTSTAANGSALAETGVETGTALWSALALLTAAGALLVVGERQRRKSHSHRA
jgi:hypothetical protein